MAKLDAMELPGIPKRQNCLAWSEDGELAIAVGDQIVVLTPKRSPVTNDTHETPWHRTQFTAGSFSQGEWPPVALESMLAMHGAFIGREQAAAEVVSLQWSPPGIAPGFRCALAVLTSNYLLSIWTADSSSSLETKWTRRCVINSYIASDLPPIVAMGWAPILDTNKLRNNDEAVPPHRAPLAWRYHLAVILQNMTLAIVGLTSPSRTQQTGNISICTSSAFPNAASANTDTQPCYESHVHPEAPMLGTFLHGAEWSQWKYTPRSPLAKSTILTRAYNKDIRWPISTEIEGTVRIGQPSELKQSVDIRNANGTDSVWNGACMASALKAAYKRQEEMEYICLATHEYILESYKLILEKHGNVTAQFWKPCVGPSHLDEQVNKLKLEYSEKLRLRGPVDVRVWGLASYGPYLALCLTFHPAQLLQYITPGNATFHILFSHSSMEAMGASDVASENPEPVQFPWMAFKPTEKNDFQAHDGPMPPCIPPLAENLNAVRMNAQLTLTTLISRFLHQNPNTSWGAHVVTVLAAYKNHTHSAPGIVDLLGAIQAARSTGPDAPSRMELTKIMNEFIQSRASNETSDTSPCIVEYCTVPNCGSAVFWSSSLGASCSSGHRQTRCSLTALAMLNPYTIKRCGMCARPYLDETRLETFYDDAVASGTITTAQRSAPLSENEDEDGVVWLLKAVTCVYCGGKFTRYV